MFDQIWFVFYYSRFRAANECGRQIRRVGEGRERIINLGGMIRE